tara:strand:- start:4329 stop:4625 length:297 start_codon:yes stop_codon:yes gene_type:complete
LASIKPVETCEFARLLRPCASFAEPRFHPPPFSFAMKKNCSSSASQAATCWLFIVLFMSSISASAKAMTLHSFNCMKVSAMSATLHHVFDRDICCPEF